MKRLMVFVAWGWLGVLGGLGAQQLPECGTYFDQRIGFRTAYLSCTTRECAQSGTVNTLYGYAGGRRGSLCSRLDDCDPWAAPGSTANSLVLTAESRDRIRRLVDCPERYLQGSKQPQCLQGASDGYAEAEEHYRGLARALAAASPWEEWPVPLQSLYSSPSGGPCEVTERAAVLASLLPESRPLYVALNASQQQGPPPESWPVQCRALVPGSLQSCSVVEGPLSEERLEDLDVVLIGSGADILRRDFLGFHRVYVQAEEAGVRLVCFRKGLIQSCGPVVTLVAPGAPPEGDPPPAPSWPELPEEGDPLPPIDPPADDGGDAVPPAISPARVSVTLCVDGSQVVTKPYQEGVCGPGFGGPCTCAAGWCIFVQEGACIDGS